MRLSLILGVFLASPLFVLGSFNQESPSKVISNSPSLATSRTPYKHVNKLGSHWDKRKLDAETYEIYYKQSHAVISLVKEFDLLFANGYIDYSTFEEKQDEWLKRLIEIEEAAKGVLHGKYNLDTWIQLFQNRFTALEKAREIRKRFASDSYAGSALLLEAFELGVRILNFYRYDGAIRPEIAFPQIEFHLLEEEFSDLKKDFEEEFGVDPVVRSFFDEQVKEVETSLKTLKIKNGETKKKDDVSP